MTTATSTTTTSSSSSTQTKAKKAAPKVGDVIELKQQPKTVKSDWKTESVDLRNLSLMLGIRDEITRARKVSHNVEIKMRNVSRINSDFSFDWKTGYFMTRGARVNGPIVLGQKQNSGYECTAIAWGEDDTALKIENFEKKTVLYISFKERHFLIKTNGGEQVGTIDQNKNEVVFSMTTQL